jgi:hypothetical protein
MSYDLSFEAMANVIQNISPTWPKKKVPTTEIDSTENDGLLQLFYGPGKYLEVEVPNEEYSKQQSTIKDLIQTSARLGMRGEFDFLWRFSGTDLAEIIEFHKSWFDIINLYSHRSLTRHEGKLVAMSGIASFIQRNTKFTYNSGLWQEIMSLNLLWTMISKSKRQAETFCSHLVMGFCGWHNHQSSQRGRAPREQSIPESVGISGPSCR